MPVLEEERELLFGNAPNVEVFSIAVLENWKSHKAMCKALHSLETDEEFKSMVETLQTAPYEDLKKLDAVTHSNLVIQLRYLRSSLKRDFNVSERNLIGWEPRCMGCGRTERTLRVEAASSKGSTSAPVALKSCHACKMAFYCSQNHWDAVQHQHAEESCEDGHDGLTQCHINQEIRQDVAFASIMAKASPNEFSWAPERVKPSWESLENTNWDKEYSSGISQVFGISTEAAGPFVRAASVGLSMPMTILWALEHLNTDDAWTRKDTLTIHVLGAFDVEINHANIFEEILHRLPEVKTLRLVLCGPELAKLASSSELKKEFDMETCPTCAARKRKRIQRLYAQTYHEYAKAMGSNFAKPDLAVAFNSGSSQEATAPWKETMSFLVKTRIPSVFTAYNRDEAEAEATLLQSAGAKLVPELGPLKNVWGSISCKKEPNRVTSFYAINSWLAGAFR
ncbi:hypothetical protein C0991_008251 [Blastosporella zonata]|nr:hypothetical protein C0991_008251 [Blastosporella zonata]